MCTYPPMMGDSSQRYTPIKADNAPYLRVIVKPRHNIEAMPGGSSRTDRNDTIH